MLENQKEGQYGRNRAALGVAEVREAERGPLPEVSGNVMSPVIEGSLFVVYIKFVLLKEPRDFFFFPKSSFRSTGKQSRKYRVPPIHLNARRTVPPVLSILH